MKKFWLALVGTLMAFNVSAAGFSEGKQYVDLKDPVANQPQVVEFFSFYCPHCYQFENVYHVPATVEKNLPAGVTHERYHVSFLGPLGDALTDAWAVAIVMKIEDKVTPILFDGIQKTRTINSKDDIRNAFIKAGVTGEDYDAALNSFIVQSVAAKERQAAKDFALRGVPAVFVNGKYQVNNGGIEAASALEYGKGFSDVVNYLLTKK
ncbi:thiol:disulfide interchange protein DsbA [Xenorhabdus nematophila]|uniref:Thiol:disulfide interchange protein n=1 Tax=Xenorhabdus nematophila (strain ATCC 19061 / DSM 3370 / CCUG 14189 / LMG 1036 / NCIMB 9965 / AN6) TaxID=406817 RepID=D3VEA1_XENNA|nr:thiol:disulfide interchange protein DsbA [Xenorhabdus nematophila]AYA41912.1 thiol:disulfide interchange protein DsbA [Xenorhabdus nematophila]KHD29302.1 protein disulfide isomerase [Xenorhabdus nematophila]MBA0020641.1 thiol:disulfide interchange protein DsbA [Xenorhabdus nematophila]MCB4425292.1 thiol:disulfide interchange protein DsbA [Xenorhabdus nematophila]QNJ36285.1 thiol:disulfide interchange protein DsbA [Xenorhabdus nematophila]